MILYIVLVTVLLQVCLVLDFFFFEPKIFKKSVCVNDFVNLLNWTD